MSPTKGLYEERVDFDDEMPSMIPERERERPIRGSEKKETAFFSFNRKRRSIAGKRLKQLRMTPGEEEGKRDERTVRVFSSYHRQQNNIRLSMAWREVNERSPDPFSNDDSSPRYE